MAYVVINFALTKCTMGIAPMPLTVIPKGVYYVIGVFSIATITDSIPFLSIKPFVLCTSLANPIVAAIFAASLGTVQKGPCIPLTITWMPMAPTILVRNIPILVNTSKLICIFGGIIDFVIPGQFPTSSK